MQFETHIDNIYMYMSVQSSGPFDCTRSCWQHINHNTLLNKRTVFGVAGEENCHTQTHTISAACHVFSARTKKKLLVQPSGRHYGHFVYIRSILLPTKHGNAGQNIFQTLLTHNCAFLCHSRVCEFECVCVCVRLIK